MQAELDAEGLPVEVSILGINAAGLEAGNATITAGRTLPWLQDTAADNVWASWNVVWRDVWILDTNNVPVGVFNLTEHDLGDPAQYAAFRTMLENVSKGLPPQ